MKSKKYRFIGTDPRFQPGEEFAINDICGQTGLPHSAVRMRLTGLDSFDDCHLQKLNQRYSGHARRQFRIHANFQILQNLKKYCENTAKRTNKIYVSFR
jgi:hypothetical protein